MPADRIPSNALPSRLKKEKQRWTKTMMDRLHKWGHRRHWDWHWGDHWTW